MARGLKKVEKVEKVEWLNYLCIENKGADQLRGYREADLRICFRICKKSISHDAAHLMYIVGYRNNFATVRVELKQKSKVPLRHYLSVQESPLKMAKLPISAYGAENLEYLIYA